MLVIDLPHRTQGGSGLRARVLGGVRIHTAMSHLAAAGEAQVVWRGPSMVQTVGEAIQWIEMVEGRRVPPDPLYGLLFGDGARPDATPLLTRDADVNLIEISDSDEIVFGDWVLSVPAFRSRVVSALPQETGLAWWRALNRTANPKGKGKAEGAEAEALIAALEAQGDPTAETLIEIVRTAQKAPGEIRTLRKRLGDAIGEGPLPWVVVGPPHDPEAADEASQARRALTEMLETACKGSGAHWHDTAGLVARHGTGSVLAGDGYAEAFQINLGRYLGLWAHEAFDPAKARAKSRTSAKAPGPAPVLDPAELETQRRQLADELAEAHLPRLQKLGATRSGLHDYYANLIGERATPGNYEVQMMGRLVDHLPAFDTYFVMQAGIGELALWLAMNGRRVVAHELFADRREALQVGIDHLVAKGLLDRSMIDVCPGIAEPVVNDGRCVGVATSLLLAADDAWKGKAEAFRGLDALLVEPRLFLRMRSDDGSQAEAIQFLADLGLDRARSSPHYAFTQFGRTQPLTTADRAEMVVVTAETISTLPTGSTAEHFVQLKEEAWQPPVPRNRWERFLDWAGFL